MVAKFLPYLKAHRWQVAWALAQVFLVAAFELLKPWPLQVVIDYVLGDKTPSAGGPIGDVLSWPKLSLLLFACIAIVIVNFGAGALTLWHNYTTIKVGQSPVGIAPAAGAIWVADSGSGELSRIDQTTLAVTTIDFGGQP